MKICNLWYVLAVALLPVMSGCGTGLLKVTGTVTFRGQPVPSTLVTFHPDTEGQRASHGLTDDEGNFVLSYSQGEMGVLPGRHIVTLRYHQSADEELHKVPAKASKELKAAIAHYGNAKTSTLHYDITENKQHIDIRLE